MIVKKEKNKQINKEIKETKKEKGVKLVRRRDVYIGHVLSTGDGVAKVAGLLDLQMGEVVIFHVPGAVVKGLTITIHKNYARIAIFGKDSSVYQNVKVSKTYELASVPVGLEVLGRVIDPIGNVIDNQENVFKPTEKLKADRKAKGIIYRESIKEPFLTGIITIDTMIPIGRGQRELIIGDRKTGKTSIAVDAIINQNRSYDKKKMLCVYVAIGQKRSTVVRIVNTLKKTDSLYFTTIVSATADDAAALQYLAPYSGSSIGEYYRDNGMHSLVVLDDLSKHAAAYRQMALLVRRPPGRDAYPGDIFYLHSRLLERGSKLNQVVGGGSLTTLPIVETQENDVSAYIPTNVISITDGQIYVDRRIARKGRWPAINIGLSVSRIGSAAQFKSIKETSGTLKLQLTQYYEVEHFISFASEIDDETWQTIQRGLRILEVLKQKRYAPYSIEEELSLLYSVLDGSFDGYELSEIPTVKTFVQSLAFQIKRKKKMNHITYKQGVEVIAETLKLMSLIKNEK